MNLLISAYKPIFDKNSDKIHPQLQNLIDSVDTSFIKTQKLQDSFESIGKNNKPVVVVLDNMTSNDVDINGDDINDLSHCETVSLFMADRANVLPVEAGEKYLSLDNISALIEAIESGAKIDAINLSIGMSVNKGVFEDFFFGVASQDMREVILQKAKESYDNRVDLKEQLDKTLDVNKKNKLEMLVLLAEIYPALVLFNRFSKIDIPVYISEPNNPKEKNLLEYFFKDPVIISGKRDTARQEQETFFITEHYKNGKLKGYDINNDDVVDVLKSEVSDGQPKVKQYIGRKPEGFLPDHNLFLSLTSILLKVTEDTEGIIKKCKNCLFTNKHIQYVLTNPLKIKNDLYFMPVVDKTNTQFAINMTKPLRLDNEGLLYFGPKEMNIKNAVNMIYGNSYATPTAINKDIQTGKIRIKA